MSSVLLLIHLYQKYPLCCLTGDRTLLPVNSHQSWKRGGGRAGERERKRERIGGMLYSSLSLGVCVYSACHQLLDGEDDCPESFSQQSPGLEPAALAAPRITLETQHCYHNGGTECEKIPLSQPKGWIQRSIRQEKISVRVWALDI